MNDRERLLQWMEVNDVDAKTLTERMGVTRAYTSMIINDKRDINTFFKWKFSEAFGHEIAAQLFSRQDEAPVAETV